MVGVILKALSGFYYVSSNGITYECKARGSFRKSGVSPLVGDRVEFSEDKDLKGVIDKILPRKNKLTRPPVANIDKLFIVSSYMSPAPNTLLIDKMTVIAAFNKIEPIIVFNKCDTGDFSSFESIYKNAGFKVYTVSAVNNEGIAPLERELEGAISAFTGNSGVGKSSILNVLLGDEVIETGEVSEKLGRGRHTTRHTELYALKNGGFVADTAGFSSLEIDRFDYELKESLELCFPEFVKFSENCRFSSCTHIKEPDCAVLEAVKNGEIEPTRHESYCALFDELKDLRPWQAKNNK